MTGYLLSTETESDLVALDLTRLPLPDARRRRILLLGRDKLGVDRRLNDHFEQCGADVTVMEVKDDYGRLMSHPARTQTPRTTIGAVTEWLRRADSPASLDAARPAPSEPAVSGAESIELLQDGQRIVETPLTLATPAGRCYAVLSAPGDVDREGVCAVLLNAGALRRTGPSRTWVELGRRWAARGVPTVRVDLEAIGDSDGDDERLETASLYSPAMDDQVLSVLTQLADRGLPERFVLVGLCSGAYWALHGALADPRVAAAMMVNLYSFWWSEELVAERQRRRTVAALRGDVLKRIASGGLSADRLRRSWRGFRAGVRTSVEANQENRVDEALDLLRERGTQLSLMLSLAQPLYDQFEREGRIAELHRWPNVSIEVIPSRDHVCRALWIQRYLHERFDVALDRVLERAPEAAVASGSTPS